MPQASGCDRRVAKSSEYDRPVAKSSEYDRPVAKSSEYDRRTTVVSGSGRVPSGRHEPESIRVIEEDDAGILEMFNGAPQFTKRPRPSVKPNSPFVFDKLSQASFREIYAYLQHRGNDLVESHSVFEMLTSESRSFASNFDKMLGHELIQKTLFGSDIALEDFEGMKVNNYMTSSILFAVCMFMSQKHKGYVIPPNKVFDTKSIHFIADNVAVVCPDCFAFANMRDDPDKYEHKLTVAVGEIMPQLINCKLSDPIAVLIPFSTKQTHWYVMCVYITKEMVSLVVFNSIPTIEDKEFTMDLLRVFCNCANMLFGKTTENFQRLVYDKFQQDDGTSCGVFSLFFVAMIQNNPGLINEFIIEQESLASTGRKGVR